MFFLFWSILEVLLLFSIAHMKSNINHSETLGATVERKTPTKKKLLKEGKLLLETLTEDFDLEWLSKAEKTEIKLVRKRLEKLIKEIEENNRLPDDYAETLKAWKEKLGVASIDEIKEKYADDPEKLGAIDAFQAALDVAGFEPTFGMFADLINALIYAFRAAKAWLKGEGKLAKQHTLDLGISAISIIPVADVIKILRLRKVPKLAKMTIKGTRSARTYAKKQKVKRVDTARKKMTA